MKIHVTSCTGTGPTQLASFDAALHTAGVANYNLIRLSSVIPPKSEIVIHKDIPLASELLPGDWGDRLYVVIAEQREERPNAEAWAGIGWVQEQASGKGLFVEHEGSSEASVRRDIEQSLKSLMATRGVDFGEIHMDVTGITCTTEPVCALVAAVYQASDWHNQAKLMR